MSCFNYVLKQKVWMYPFCHRLKCLNFNTFLSLKNVFILADSADPSPSLFAHILVYQYPERKWLTLCHLGNSACFYVVCYFFQNHFFLNSITVSNSLDPDQAQHFCKGYQQTTKRVKGKIQKSKPVTSTVALVVFISNLIGC